MLHIGHKTLRFVQTYEEGFRPKVLLKAHSSMRYLSVDSYCIILFICSKYLIVFISFWHLFILCVTFSPFNCFPILCHWIISVYKYGTKTSKLILLKHLYEKKQDLHVLVLISDVNCTSAKSITFLQYYKRHPFYQTILIKTIILVLHEIILFLWLKFEKD